MFTNEKITRTFSFTEGKALVFNKDTKTTEEVDFSIIYSSLNDTEEKIQKKVDKALKTRTIAIYDYKRVDRLYSMNVNDFLANATLEKIDGEYVEEENVDGE